MAVLAVPKLFPPTVGVEGGMCRACVHMGVRESLCGTRTHDTLAVHTNAVGV